MKTGRGKKGFKTYEESYEETTIIIQMGSNKESILTKGENKGRLFEDSLRELGTADIGSWA